MHFIIIHQLMERKSTLHKIWHVLKPAIEFVLTLGVSAIAKKAGSAQDQVKETGDSIKNEVIHSIDDSFDEHDQKKYGQ